jgi:hypothetical protein
MPGDPKECREHAKRCLKIAQEATNPALRASLEEIAQQWLRLAADLEATKPLLEEWGVASPGCNREAKMGGHCKIPKTTFTYGPPRT